MKSFALFAALVAATAMASAQPRLGASQPSRTELEPKKAESTRRVLLGAPKPSPPSRRQVLVDGWAEITDATPARFGTVFVRMGRAAGPFAKLRIAAVSGTVMIRRVKIHYVDGTAKVFAVTKAVSSRRQPTIVIDLGNPKTIEQIDITTDRRPKGEYSIYGTAVPTSDKQTCC